MSLDDVLIKVADNYNRMKADIQEKCGRSRNILDISLGYPIRYPDISQKISLNILKRSP